ncbi:TnsD family Tn7-like transposition protein [Pseudomonas sp.]|uniref:TnsD family Tn7-like transposition protein n=1 Tax=Pseudomonas sp. TaxID=306 RepID=UPI0028AFAE4A|nr:TnsD family Tn7-like transposition protein [Pseudomonas sp.]
MKASAWAVVDKWGAKPSAALEWKPAGSAGDIVVPEETIFGIVSRYHALTGHPTSGDTLIELLGRRCVTLGTAFPSGLNVISKHLRLQVNTIEELIEGHTILPCFRPFMNLAHYTRIANSMATGTATNTKIALGLLASRVGAEDVPRFCPVCAGVDCETIGIATWYRAHQFPGVLVCPYHGVPLVAFDCLAQRLKRTQLFLPAAAAKWSGKSNVPNVDEQERERLVLVSRLIAQLFLLRTVPVNPLTWRNHYLAHLVDRGLATASMRVHQRALQSELLGFWDSLRNLPPFDGIFARCNGEDSWLTSLYRRPRATHHPLLHVLLIGFLAESIESFLWTDIPSLVTNSAADDRASAATECKIAELAAEGRSMRQVAKEIGLSVNAVLVKAEKIGIGFMRRSKKLDVTVRSQVWHALAAGNAIADIVKTTGMSASTVNRILGADRGLQAQRTASLRVQRQAHARGKLRAVTGATPSVGFKALRTALGADFTWLYRHDRAWLQAQLPSTPRIVERTSSVDWCIRDRAMAERVTLAVGEILEPSRRPTRLTLNEIGRFTGNASWLDKHLARLPRTAELLSQVLEPAAVFRARQLAWREKHTEDALG